MQNLNQSTADHKVLYADRYLKDEQPDILISNTKNQKSNPVQSQNYKGIGKHPCVYY
jgi:hypothetical protein